MMPFKVMRLRTASSSGGGGGGAVSIDDITASDVGTGSTQTATYSLDSSGLGAATGNPNFTWLNSGSAADYDVRATLVTGDTPSGSAMSTWLNLGTSRSWTHTADIPDTTMSCSMAVEIRLSSSGVVLDTANVDINATQLS